MANMAMERNMAMAMVMKKINKYIQFNYNMTYLKLD